MKSTQEKYNISDETYKSIKQFFLNTSIPRILKQEKEEREKRLSDESRGA